MFVGVRLTFIILGAFFMVVICAGSLFMRKCPADFIPDGYVPPAKSVTKKSDDKTPLQMLRMPIFYVMMVMLTCGGTFGLMIISGAKGLALNMVGAAPSVTTMFVSVFCLFNTAGRLVAGTLSDRFGRINTLSAAMIMALFDLGLLYFSEVTASAPLFAAGIILIGVCFGTFMGVFPGFCTDRFGTKYNTVNYGIMWIGFSSAGIIGPAILSAVYASAGTYRAAFLIALAITADNLKVNLLAVGAVFAVLLFTMKSLTLPVILVLVIEGAIWINMGIPYFTDSVVQYLAYLIVSSVQLGATVDYAILMTDRYIETRRTTLKKQAVIDTVSSVTTSVLTSGIVLSLVGFLLYFISSHGILSQIGLFIGRGTLLSVVSVFFVLPGLLYLFDGIIGKTTYKLKLHTLGKDGSNEA